MDNVLAGTPQYPASATDLYPEQTLTTTHLYPGYRTNAACDACNLIPTPAWAYGACDACTRSTAAPRKYYRGRDVGDFRMTESSELVPLPGHYITQKEQARVQACSIKLRANERGNSWQSYNISSTCNP